MAKLEAMRFCCSNTGCETSKIEKLSISPLEWPVLVIIIPSEILISFVLETVSAISQAALPIAKTKYSFDKSKEDK